jgi:hypothetical protein
MTSSARRHGLYVASRASVPARAEMWRGFRAKGWPIVSSWIDEDGPGQTASMAELWPRIIHEIRGAEALVFYAEPDDFPLKGALIEVGIALDQDLPIHVAAPRVELDPRSLRPLGSWVAHSLVTVHTDVRRAMSSALIEAGCREPVVNL